MKLAILGGGGVRSIMLTRSLVKRARRLGITEMVFMDNDERKLRVFGSLCRKAASVLDPEARLSFTTDVDEAVTGADFVFTTIRSGGDAARVTDERIALSHGVIGQETTGAGGFAMAMRSIPVVADYCGLIRRRAKPGVLVFNFTNPAGLVTQAMRDLGYGFVYGICDAPTGILGQVAGLYGATMADLRVEMFGLNHLSFYPSIRLRGRDITTEVLADARLYTDTDMRYFEPDLARRMGMLLNEYLYYFYYREKALQNMLAAPKIRSEIVLEINAAMLAALEKLDCDRDFEAALKVYDTFNYRRESTYLSNESGIARRDGLLPRFDLAAGDDGAYASVALAYIEAVITGREGEMVLCLPNNGTVDWLPDTDVVETACGIGGFGARPKRLSRALPDSCRQLVCTVKLYERMAARAIIERDRSMAREALAAHPLVSSWSLAGDLLEDYSALHPGYWG
jgi:6-phospho-beta-glucosidase